MLSDIRPAPISFSTLLEDLSLKSRRRGTGNEGKY